MKTYDCFLFFNELDLLEIRLNELNSVVDYFVLVESKFSHQHNHKEYYYLQNKDRFKKFNHKIIRLEMPENLFDNNTHQNEIKSWNYIIKGLTSASNDDIIMIGAVDEIPKSKIIHDIKNNYKFPICIKMNLYYYYINTKFSHEEWHGTYITNFQSLNKSDIYNQCVGQGLCGRKNCPTQINGGWHISFMGDAKNVKFKTNNYGHDSSNHLTEEYFKIRIEKLEDPFGRTHEVKFHSLEKLEKLPSYVQNNTEKFKRYIYTP